MSREDCGHHSKSVEFFTKAGMLDQSDNIVPETWVLARGRNANGEDRRVADFHLILQSPAAPSLYRGSTSGNLIPWKHEEALGPELKIDPMIQLKLVLQVQRWEFLVAKPQQMKESGLLAAMRALQALVLFVVGNLGEEGSLMPCSQSCTVPRIARFVRLLPWAPIQSILDVCQHLPFVDLFDPLPAFSPLEFFPQGKPILLHVKAEISAAIVPGLGPDPIVCTIPLPFEKVANQSCHWSLGHSPGVLCLGEPFSDGLPSPRQ